MEQPTTLEYVYWRRKNNHTKRQVHELDKMANCLIGWTHNSSATKKIYESFNKKKIVCYSSNVTPLEWTMLPFMISQSYYLRKSFFLSIQISLKMIY